MGRKKKVEPDDKEQYARFVETAERMQSDDATEKFKETLKRILEPIHGEHSSPAVTEVSQK